MSNMKIMIHILYRNIRSDGNGIVVIWEYRRRVLECECAKFEREMISLLSDWFVTSMVRRSYNVRNPMRQGCESLLVYYPVFSSGVGWMGRIDVNSSLRAVGHTRMPPRVIN